MNEKKDDDDDAIAWDGFRPPTSSRVDIHTHCIFIYYIFHKAKDGQKIERWKWNGGKREEEEEQGQIGQISGTRCRRSP